MFRPLLLFVNKHYYFLNNVFDSINTKHTFGLLSNQFTFD